MPSRQELESLIAQLRDLSATSPGKQGDLAAWYARAHECQAFIRARPALSNMVPHEVWHYLSDADIRVKDPEYRTMQQAQISELILQLERANKPVDAA